MANNIVTFSNILKFAVYLITFVFHFFQSFFQGNTIQWEVWNIKTIYNLIILFIISYLFCYKANNFQHSLKSLIIGRFHFNRRPYITQWYARGSNGSVNNSESCDFRSQFDLLHMTFCWHIHFEGKSIKSVSLKIVEI